MLIFFNSCLSKIARSLTALWVTQIALEAIEFEAGADEFLFNDKELSDTHVLDALDIIAFGNVTI